MTGRILRRWFGIGSIATTVLAVYHAVVPLHQAAVAFAAVAVTSFLISAWQEWVLTRKER